MLTQNNFNYNVHRQRGPQILMFEFEDSKLGRLKVINITEARANIASIMNDGEFNYVITKNNKPVRAIINYGDFKKSSVSKNTRFAPPKNQVKGLLESRAADVKASEDIIAPQTSQPKRKKQAVNASDSYFEDSVDYQNQNTSFQDDLLPQESIQNFEESNTSELEENSPQNEYFNKYRKLYETPVMAPLVAPLVAPQSYENDEKVVPPRRPIQPEPVKSQPSRIANDPPSIQDLLNDLENEKLSGEDEEI